MRVSKADGAQTTDLQRDALPAAGIDADSVYEDRASGKKDDRSRPWDRPSGPAHQALRDRPADRRSMRIPHRSTTSSLSASTRTPHVTCSRSWPTANTAYPPSSPASPGPTTGSVRCPTGSPPTRSSTGSPPTPPRSTSARSTWAGDAAKGPAPPTDSGNNHRRPTNTRVRLHRLEKNGAPPGTRNSATNCPDVSNCPGPALPGAAMRQQLDFGLEDWKTGAWHRDRLNVGETGS